MDKNILLIEDDIALREGITLILEAEGYHVYGLKDGSELRSYLRKHAFGLFLIDYRLPGKDGLQIAQYLRGQPDSRQTPIIIMSASGYDLRQKVHKAGADEFLRKPFQIDVLIGLVQKYLSRS